MKKIYNILLSFVFAGCLLGSCDYLDIVPNETANEEDAFASEQAALNYLYSCYSFMPAYQNSHTFIGYAGDEIVSCFNGEPIKLYFQEDILQEISAMWMRHTVICIKVYGNVIC